MKYLKTIGFNSNQPIGRGFNYPYDIAFSADGRIFVLNRMGTQVQRGIRIQICTFDEDWLGEFSTGPGDGDDQLKVPVCMDFDADDNLYVTDEVLNQVKVFDNQGNFVRKWGGNGDGDLAGPSGIAHGADGSVYIVEQYANRVHKMTAAGESVLSWGKEGAGESQFDLPWGATTDADGNVYIADWRNDRIQKFDPDGGFIAAFGESGDGDGQFHRPSSVAVTADGLICVADWGNERVQVLDPDGEFHQTLSGEATLSKWADRVAGGQPGRVRPAQAVRAAGERPSSAPHERLPHRLPVGAYLLGAGLSQARLRRPAVRHRAQPPPDSGV